MANIFRRSKIDAEELQKELVQKEEEIQRFKDLMNESLQDLKAIHLYAALSEEETQVESLKEKQTRIIEISEKIIKKLS